MQTNRRIGPTKRSYGLPIMSIMSQSCADRCAPRRQVATQRTRTASKALIPSLSDPVGKLNGLGGMTVKKLIDLGNQVREARSSILADVPMASASTGRAPPPLPGAMSAQPAASYLACLRLLYTALFHPWLDMANTRMPGQREGRPALWPDSASNGVAE